MWISGIGKMARQLNKSAQMRAANTSRKTRVARRALMQTRSSSVSRGANVARGALMQAARLILLLLAMSFVIFALVSASPIDPVSQNVGQAALANMSEDKLAQLNNWWGTDTPFLERYASWLISLLQGDAGTSLRFNAPVTTVIANRALTSFALMGAAWLISGILGFAAGVAAGTCAGKPIDKCVQAYCFLLASTPTFWIALLALMIFSVQLGWFPIGFSTPIGKSAASVTLADAAHHMVLPALVLALTGIANVALHTREKVIDVMNSDFVKYARAQGESMPQICMRHVIRAVSLPAITLQCANAAEIFGGSVLVEQVFSYPGLGQAAITAGLGGDAPLLCAIALVSAVFVFVFNALANVAYGALDPRMRACGGVATTAKRGMPFRTQKKKQSRACGGAK